MSKKNIIIIEDDPVFSKLLKAYLLKLNHPLRYKHYGSVEEAQSGIHNDHPDLVLLDNDLPGEKGIDAIQFFQQFTDNIIIMSGDKQVENMARAYKKGAVDYYYKNPLILEHVKDAVLKLY